MAGIWQFPRLSLHTVRVYYSLGSSSAAGLRTAASWAPGIGAGWASLGLFLQVFFSTRPEWFKLLLLGFNLSLPRQRLGFTVI